MPTAGERCVLPVGSIEPHAMLRAASDVLLAGQVARAAAEPLRVPVFPPLTHDLSASFAAFPARTSLQLAPFLAVVRERLVELHAQGYRCIVLVNGHAGTASLAALASTLAAERPGLQVKVHDWWHATRTQEWLCRLPAEPATGDLEGLLQAGVASTRAQIEGPWR